MTPTWRLIRLWPTWLSSAQGKCFSTGLCLQPDWISGASYREQRVTLAGVKPTLALAEVQVRRPSPSTPSQLHWSWASEVGSAEASQNPQHKEWEELLLVKGLTLILQVLHTQILDEDTRQHVIDLLPLTFYKFVFFHSSTFVFAFSISRLHFSPFD